MKHDILYSPDNTAVKFILNTGEAVRAESDAMLCMSEGVNITTGFGMGKRSGGKLKNFLRAALTQESFFTNVFTATADGQEILLAPSLEGDIEVIDLSQTGRLIIQGSSFLAAHPDVALNTKWQGFKSFVSGESMFMMEASGDGMVVISAFGGVARVEVNGSYVVDTGHIVAFDAGLNYRVTKAGSGWISSFLSGEGLVCEFTGKGNLYLQSRNPQEFGKFVGPKLKPRKQQG